VRVRLREGRRSGAPQASPESMNTVSAGMGTAAGLDPGLHCAVLG
jgi:hypothetical protein